MKKLICLVFVLIVGAPLEKGFTEEGLIDFPELIGSNGLKYKLTSLDISPTDNTTPVKDIHVPNSQFYFGVYVFLRSDGSGELFNKACSIPFSEHKSSVPYVIAFPGDGGITNDPEFPKTLFPLAERLAAICVRLVSVIGHTSWDQDGNNATTPSEKAAFPARSIGYAVDIVQKQHVSGTQFAYYGGSASALYGAKLIDFINGKTPPELKRIFFLGGPPGINLWDVCKHSDSASPAALAVQSLSNHELCDQISKLDIKKRSNYDLLSPTVKNAFETLLNTVHVNIFAGRKDHLYTENLNDKTKWTMAGRYVGIDYIPGAVDSFVEKILGDKVNDSAIRCPVPSTHSTERICITERNCDHNPDPDLNNPDLVVPTEICKLVAIDFGKDPNLCTLNKMPDYPNLPYYKALDQETNLIGIDVTDKDSYGKDFNIKRSTVLINEGNGLFSVKPGSWQEETKTTASEAIYHNDSHILYIPLINLLDQQNAPNVAVELKDVLLSFNPGNQRLTFISASPNR
jgi:hypothetical protein